MITDVINILKQTGALLTNDHFVYTTGKHGSVYINKDIMYIHTKKSSEIGRLFAEKCKEINMDVIAAPAFGGIVLPPPFFCSRCYLFYPDTMFADSHKE